MAGMLAMPARSAREIRTAETGTCSRLLAVVRFAELAFRKDDFLSARGLSARFRILCGHLPDADFLAAQGSGSRNAIGIASASRSRRNPGCCGAICTAACQRFRFGNPWTMRARPCFRRARNAGLRRLHGDGGRAASFSFRSRPGPASPWSCRNPFSRKTHPAGPGKRELLPPRGRAWRRIAS